MVLALHFSDGSTMKMATRKMDEGSPPQLDDTGVPKRKRRCDKTCLSCCSCCSTVVLVLLLLLSGLAAWHACMKAAHPPATAPGEFVQMANGGPKIHIYCTGSNASVRPCALMCSKMCPRTTAFAPPLPLPLNPSCSALSDAPDCALPSPSPRPAHPPFAPRTRPLAPAAVRHIPQRHLRLLSRFGLGASPYRRRLLRRAVLLHRSPRWWVE